MRCWFRHKWGRWSNDGTTANGWLVQIRSCSRCGKAKQRIAL